MKLKIIKITDHEQTVDFEVELDLSDFVPQVKKTKEKILVHIVKTIQII